MQVLDRTQAVDEEQTATATDEAEKRGPNLTPEQREWLNRVFIPNFRAELMRALELKGHLKDNGSHKARASREKGSKTSSEDKAVATSLPDADRKPADVDNSTQTLTQRPDEAAAQRLTELEAENKRLRAVVADTRVDRELVWAAASQHAINPAQVAHLIKDRVRLDKDLEPVVVNAQGDRLADRYGRPVTVADAVRTFLEENPHMVRPSTEFAGGGSGGTDATVRTRRVAAVTGGDLIEEALREGE
jgi:hypothetical protein